jgi:trehalose/maltose transport system permease protein
MAKKSSGMTEIAKAEERLAYWLLIPTFVIIVAIAFYPLGSVFYNSFTNKIFASETPTEVVGLDNYKKLLSITIKELPPVIDPDTGQPAIDPETGEIQYERAINVLPREPTRYRELTQFSLFGNRYVIGAIDRDFIRSVWDTIIFTVATVVLELILGMGIALVINSLRPTSIARAGAMAVMLVPWAIPTAVSSRMWQWMFGASRTGFFNVVFQILGLGNGQISFLTDERYQLPAMIVIDVWKTTPFMALLLLAGLGLISKDIYEAADVDGANKFRQFVSMTLPLLRPTLAVALIFRTLDALRVFDVFQIVLAQSRYSMASYTYYQLVGARAMGYSSASSVLIFLLIFVFAMAYIRLLGVEAD